MTAAAHSPAVVSRVAPGGRNVADDRVAIEAPVAFVYNCTSHVVMMASPGDLEDFAYGFSLAEGIVESAAEIRSIAVLPRRAGLSLSIEIPEHRAAALGGRSRNLAGRTGCGLCGIADLEQALRPLSPLPDTPAIATDAIGRAIDALPARQALNRDTGAVHAAGFAAADGTLLCVREDVGRHNALDKLVGALARDGVDPASGFVLVTSRCSMEMVQKTVTFGCPVLVAVSAPTSLAIDLAERSNPTVAAFARQGRFNLYAHPERVA